MMLSRRNHGHGGSVSVATQEEETEAIRDRKPVALFMAFGTKGDIFPVAVPLSLSLYLSLYSTRSHADTELER